VAQQTDGALGLWAPAPAAGLLLALELRGRGDLGREALLALIQARELRRAPSAAMLSIASEGGDICVGTCCFCASAHAASRTRHACCGAPMRLRRRVCRVAHGACEETAEKGGVCACVCVCARARSCVRARAQEEAASVRREARRRRDLGQARRAAFARAAPGIGPAARVQLRRGAGWVDGVVHCKAPAPAPAAAPAAFACGSSADAWLVRLVDAVGPPARCRLSPRLFGVRWRLGPSRCEAPAAALPGVGLPGPEPTGRAVKVWPVHLSPAPAEVASLAPACPFPADTASASAAEAVASAANSAWDVERRAERRRSMSGLLLLALAAEAEACAATAERAAATAEWAAAAAERAAAAAGAMVLCDLTRRAERRLPGPRIARPGGGPGHLRDRPARARRLLAFGD
jgi:hypothetical protein